jgi:molybdopterin-guanine dinucleotide biosynthesis protein A
MGRDKALLPHPAGGSFLSHAVTVLGGPCQRVVISGAAPLAGIANLIDPVLEQGPAMGVATALRYAHEEGFAEVIVLAVDMPEIDAEALRRLVNVTPEPAGAIVAATFDGQFLEPLCARYPVRYAESLHRLAGSQDRSLTRWLRNQPVVPVVLPRAAAVNLNTPDEWSRYRTETEANGNGS